MNVFLADVPYDQPVEMDSINPQTPTVDVAFVIGANDVVNPAARQEKSSPIYGMPIINVDRAQRFCTQALDGIRLCRRGKPALFQGEDSHGLRGCEANAAGNRKRI
jgi:hypothetical protein